MKKNQLIITLCLIGFIAIGSAIKHSSGEFGKSGSPGEETCTACHDNAGAPGSVAIESNIPNNKYALNQTYSITVTVTQAASKVFGLSFEALDSTNASAGTFVITNANETKIGDADGRSAVTQVYDGGAATGSKAFSFNWTSPATDIGQVKFYVAGIACDADGTFDGDNTYTANVLVNSPTTTIGIENIARIEKISIFPNPIQDKLNITFNNNGSGYVKASLYSITGQKVAELFNENLNEGSAVKTVQIPSNIAKGAYIVNLEKEGQTFSKKVFIQ